MSSRALKLVADVLSLRAPPRGLFYSARNKINQWLGSGDRRFEFEKRYLEKGDVWGYETSDYEKAKYQQTLDFILAHRAGSAAVLEVGCSIGVFTELLADHFEQVLAVDVSREALALAEQRHGKPNIKFTRADIREIPAGNRYDVIVCAEVLYYVPAEDIDLVAKKLSGLLSETGIIVTVSGFTDPKTGPRYFEDWTDALTGLFNRLALEDFEHSSRPYRIAAFAPNYVQHVPPL